MFAPALNHQQIWDMLPLSDAQKKEIYEDFILTGNYDRLPNDDDFPEKSDLKETKDANCDSQKTR
jgi:hypothetical protein